jgi:hypothetical protein
MTFLSFQALYSTSSGKQMILNCLAEHNPPADGSISDRLHGTKAAELRRLKMKNVLMLMLYSDDFTVGFSS